MSKQRFRRERADGTRFTRETAGVRKRRNRRRNVAAKFARRVNR